MLDKTQHELCKMHNTCYNTRAGLPECAVSKMSGPPPNTTQDRTQTKDTHPIPGQKLKFLSPAGNRTRAAVLEGRDSTDHATARDS